MERFALDTGSDYPDVTPLIEQYSARSEATRRRILTTFLIVAAALVAVFGLFLTKIAENMVASHVPLPFLLLPFLAFALISYITLFSIYRGYSDAAEDLWMPVLAQSCGMQYDADKKLTAKQLWPFGILPGYTTFESNRYMSGAFSEGSVEISELAVLSPNSKESRDNFIGLALLLATGKPVPHVTVFDNTGRMKEILLGGVEPVKLESPQFNAQFRVYAGDQVESRVLLTPGLMERMMQAATLLRELAESEMSDSGSSRGLTWSFLDRHLLILLPTKFRLFVPGSLFSPVSALNIQDVVHKLQLIRSVTRTLKLGLESEEPAEDVRPVMTQQQQPHLPPNMPPADEW